MKKLSTILSFVVLVLVISVGICWYYQPDDKSITKLQVENTSASDTVKVYLTLNSGADFTNNVNGIFGISSKNKLQGSFNLLPGEIKTYTPKSAFSGNISFWDPPLNCPYPGTTLYEFTLNNEGTVTNAQETVDISCVAGVTSIGEISMTGGGSWTDNVTKGSINSIKNKEIYHNTGISGVFPFGCTNCTNTNGAPDCEGHPGYADPNNRNLCNVQRNADESGGTVCISYIRKAL